MVVVVLVVGLRVGLSHHSFAMSQETAGAPGASVVPKSKKNQLHEISKLNEWLKSDSQDEYQTQ